MGRLVYHIPHTSSHIPHTTGSRRKYHTPAGVEIILRALILRNNLASSRAIILRPKNTAAVSGVSASRFGSGVGLGFARYARNVLGWLVGESGYSVCAIFDTCKRPGRYGHYRFGKTHTHLVFSAIPFLRAFFFSPASSSFIPLFLGLPSFFLV